MTDENIATTTVDEKTGEIVQNIVFTPIEYHDWEQRGNFIICNSCTHKHAAELSPDKVLTADENGNPIILGVEDEWKRRLKE